MTRSSAWTGLGGALIRIPVSCALAFAILALLGARDPALVWESELVLRPWARWLLAIAIGLPSLNVLYLFARSFNRRDR